MQSDYRYIYSIKKKAGWNRAQHMKKYTMAAADANIQHRSLTGPMSSEPSRLPESDH